MNSVLKFEKSASCLTSGLKRGIICNIKLYYTIIILSIGVVCYIPSSNLLFCGYEVTMMKPMV